MTHNENGTTDASMKPIPVTIVTGFLGAGKTTLLRSLLRKANPLMHVAVIENEFAVAYGIENEFLSDVSAKQREQGIFDELYEFGNGCVCCSSKGDFIAALHDIIDKRKHIDWLLIELTGLSDPGPVAAIFDDVSLHGRFVLDGVITVVDSRHFELQLQQSTHQPIVDADSGAVIKNEALAQIVVADVVLLNKLDLVTGDEMRRLRALVTQLNPAAFVYESKHADVELDKVLQARANIDQTKRLAIDETPSVHDPSIQSFCVGFNGYVDVAMLSRTLNDIAHKLDKQLLRVKGVAFASDTNTVGDESIVHDQILLIQGLHSMVNFSVGRKRDNDEEVANKIVFIGHKLNRASIERQLRDCVVKNS